jgi:hypothetical protein
MHFNDIREAQSKEEINLDLRDHIWEKDNMECLHSGFTTGCSDDPNFRVLFLSLWYRDGMYIVRLQDREKGERCYVETETLENLFQNLELLLKSGRLKWKPDGIPSKNSQGYK